MNSRSIWKNVAVAVAAACMAAPWTARAATIWREGEDASGSTMNRHPWWYDQVKADQLSGGKWMSNFSKEKEGQASYDLEVPEAGDYTFWVRANPVHCKLSYRLDAGPWKEIDFTAAVDTKNIAADDKPDLRFIAWVNVGKVTLTKGAHTLAFKMHSGQATQNHGGLDAFVLTTEPFTPQGATKPDGSTAGSPAGASPDLAAADSWAFDPPVDRFGDDALLDLRSLNEKVAGESGFVRLSQDGMSFVDGRGRPMRFFAVVSDGSRLKPDDMDHHFRRLAKLGVNMVRLHANLANWKEGAKITDVNEEAIGQILRGVAAAKRHGIYVTLSPFWAWGKTPKSWNLDGCEGLKPWGVLFFHPEFQKGYQAWVRALYTRKNPQTGLALKDEPAVAIIQVKNEDSMLFYTMQSLPAPQQRILNRQYGDWLARQYGSLDKAQAAWKGAAHKDDDFAAGLAGMHITWFLTQNQTGPQALRLRDQLRFLAWRQHKFYSDMHEFYRKELGCKQLTNAMNWRSADKLKLDDVERWTYTACDVTAVNRYAGGAHEGTNNGWRIDPGHVLTNVSLLRNPLQIPTNLKQVVGSPMIVTESTWVNPNLYQSEGPMVASAYQSLTGVDGFYWFATGEKDWMRDPRLMFARVGDSYAIQKWTCATPPLMGMFPANALLLRKGYLRQGSPVVHEERTMDELWDRKHPLIAETEAFDVNRDTRDLREQAGGKVDVSRLAFLVGPVEVKFGGDPARTRVADLTPYVDADKSAVRSNTGQIELNWSAGLLRVDAPKAQGAAGFLKDAGGTFALADVTIESDNDYAAVQAVAMDDLPLKQSRKVLVQVGTYARLTGWTTRQATVEVERKPVPGQRIVSTGKPPWRVRNTRVTLTLRNPSIRKATLLDPAGYGAADLPIARTATAVNLKLPPNALYVILSAE